MAWCIESILFIQVDDHFSIAVRLEMMTLLNQTIAQIPVIVDFPIEDDRDRACHGTR